MDRRFRRASLVGGALAMAVFAWVLFLGRAELTVAPTSDFYDLQTRAWFDGRWDIADVPDPDTGATVNPLSIEAFVVDGHSYLYFGPVPSVLRVPVLAVTDELDGELAQFSMVAAFALALGALVHLSWRIRWLARGAVAVHRREALITALVTFGLGAGTVLAYLASQPVVYHEAILWGVAWALASYASLLEVMVRPSVRAVAWAGAFAALALLSRASVGIGPIVAIALVLVVQVASAWRRRRATGRDSDEEDGEAPGDRLQLAFRQFVPAAPAGDLRASLLALGLAVLVPVGLYAAVNLARFDTPFRLPIEQQVFSEVDPDRIAALEDNDGSIFGLRYLPTTLWQYARPDAIELDGLAPWVNFPREQATVVGDVVFDTRDEASSVPATMPLLVVLGVVGLVAVIRPPPGSGARGSTLAVLRIPVLGAAAGCAGMLAIAFVAHRYLGDVFPLLALLALAGLHRCGRWFGGPLRPGSVAVGSGLLLLGIWGLVANLGLALEYQRLIAPVDPGLRTGLVQRQYELGPGEPPAPIARVTDRGDLPEDPGRRGDVAVLGPRCDAVAWSDGFGWHVLPDSDDLCAELVGGQQGSSSKRNW